MYLPYLRGKQFELIALRELNYCNINANLISPVLEVVKPINSTFSTSLNSCFNNNIFLNVILNPKVGYYSVNENVDLLEYCNRHINNEMPLCPTFLINSGIDLNYTANILRRNGYNQRGFSLIHKTRISDIGQIDNFFAEFPNVKYNLIDTNIGQRYNRNFTLASIVNLSDPFITEVRNANFLNRNGEEFTEEHLYYTEEGLAGFSDYLTIGSDYNEGGFLPYAVAIHFTYVNHEDQKIWIKHFASTSNDDYSDPAGKFGEALDKLIRFIDNENINTYAANEFREINNARSYPGLGVIKKLSILNHIEVVQSVL